ncbi:MAG: uridine kinase [Planctomycetes bacterium]|nr:uridine kinase [Planctomycetota bacterium]
MAEIIKGVGGRRTHIKSRLMRESLLDKGVVRSTQTDQEISILPDVNVLALGGQSIIDRGKGVLFPLLDEIVRCRKKHKIIIGVGGGARTRHTYHVCLDLGIPTGGLAMVAGAVDEQNSKMIGCLLAKHKGIVLNKDHFLDLPLWLEYGMIPIMTGMPPYHYWEPPTGEQRLPSNGEDSGLYMVAEVMGVRSIIYLKDEDGLYTADPKKDPSAEFIPQITARELLARNLPDLLIEPAVVKTMLNARHTRRIQIINGLKPEFLRPALEGKQVGTIIYADEADMNGSSPIAQASRHRNDRNGNASPRRKSSRGK